LRQRLVQAVAEHYVCISVADTGVGMEAEVMRRVFESYFTTKKLSRGSGLVLTIVYRIVAEHAGFIEATSEPGCGSTFHIYLRFHETHQWQTVCDAEVAAYCCLAQLYNGVDSAPVVDQ